MGHEEWLRAKDEEGGKEIDGGENLKRSETREKGAWSKSR